jgi:hypothetical protein
MSGEYLVGNVLVEESLMGYMGLFVVKDQCVEVFVKRDEIGKDQVPVIPDWDYMNCHYGSRHGRIEIETCSDTN